VPINQQYFVLAIVATGILLAGLFKSIHSIYKTREHMYVFTSVFCILFMLMLLFSATENFMLAGFMVVPLSLLSLIWWWKYPPRKWVQQPQMQQAIQKEVEKKRWSSKEPLKLSDFASYRAWIKIASKYGMRKALSVLYFFFLGINIGVHLCLYIIGVPLRPSSAASIVVIPIFFLYFMREIIRKFLEAEGIKERKEGTHESPKELKELYGMLLSAYTQFYGSRNRQVLDDKITALTKQGLSREEAIRKLAEKEGLIEKA